MARRPPPPPAAASALGPPTYVRLSAPLSERIEAIARRFEQDHQHTRVTRAYMLRVLILRGLDSLEREHDARPVALAPTGTGR